MTVAESVVWFWWCALGAKTQASFAIIGKQGQVHVGIGGLPFCTSLTPMK